ncbi:MAG: hypothetical protein ILA06_09905 [Bacteroidaceae bacterium]|nr:hypothetical protein [Bacteroidaceae bacterium]
MRRELLTLFLLYCALAASAANRLDSLVQRLRLFGERIPQEKVFVHMDNTGYFLGDTIWFAAYTRRTNSDRPSKISRVLYAELWNHDGYLVERKLVEMIDGRGRGFFALPDTLYSGYFELRAYTRWQLNWGQTEHFHAWGKELGFYNKAMAKDFFRDYEKLYSRVFPVYDKPKVKGDFYKDMTFRPLRRYFKTALPPPELRLSIYPEGGNLVAGAPCRMAFEAATSEGEVREGMLTLMVKNEKVGMKNDNGEEVDFVRTENRGRGSFIFTPEAGKSYDVVFTADEVEGRIIMEKNKKAENQVTQKIKDVEPNGVALQVRREGDEWVADIHICGVARLQAMGLTIMHEGVLEHFEQLRGERSEVRIVGDSLAAGVNQLTVFDDAGRVYADRLFFVTKPEVMQPTLSISGIKDQYEPFEKVALTINTHTSPAATPQSPDRLSLAVRDAVHTDITFDSGNVMTEMLLASEIKGFVPQPEWYFEKDDEEHRRGLDLLMMTQGWRRFNWQEMAVKDAFELTHPAEYTQMVTGTVNRYSTDFDTSQRYYRDVLEEQYSILDESQIRYNYHGTRRTSVNLNPFYDEQESFGAIAYTRSGVQGRQSQRWIQDDYRSFVQSLKSYDKEKQDRLIQGQRHFIERGNLKKEVKVHAEFVDPLTPQNSLVGEMETQNGRFKIDLPRFEGECFFYLDASDTTKWKRRWEGMRKRHPRQWIQMEDDEYTRLPKDPEFYVRLNFPYPRFVKPYTFYQVHNAPVGDTTLLSPRLLTDGTHLMEQVTVRARHGGLRHIDLTKPAYVIDAYEAGNAAMDAGRLSYLNATRYEASPPPGAGDMDRILFGVLDTYIGDMGVNRDYNYSVYFDTIKVESYYPYDSALNWINAHYPGPAERRRWQRLEYIDKIYIFTDYSPRREGDARFEQANQPSVDVMLARYPDWTRRVTYLNRRYVLPGFAYQEDFYHPDYQRHPPRDGLKDYRRTLYWNPDLQLDADGRASVTFYNNSQNTSILVEAEGQTADGQLLYNR